MRNLKTFFLLVIAMTFGIAGAYGATATGLDPMKVLVTMDGSQWKGTFRGDAGDYGNFVREDVADFWDEDNGKSIAMRVWTTATYANGNIREYEYIYYGKPQGDKVVFTKRADTINGGEPEPLEDYMPNTLTIKDSNTIEFDHVTLTRSK